MKFAILSPSTTALLFFFFYHHFCAAEQAARKWLNTEGKEITATYLKVDGDNVMLKLATGKTVPYPIQKLSKNDQDFITSLAANQTKAGEEDDTVNFDDKWPESVTFRDNSDIEIVTEDDEKKEYVYRSRNYEYKCDVKLNQSVVRTFSRLFEATYEYCRAVPLALNGSQKSDEKLSILLFETHASYVKAGGPPPSAGVYIPSSNVIMVPLESLGVKKIGGGYSVDREKTNNTLPHEITHQLTPRAYFQSGSKGWFSEGIAEYIASTPYNNGFYRVKGNFSGIESYATDFGKGGKGGRALGKDIKVGNLKNYMMQSYSSFTANGNFNYGVGVLVTYYFLHLDGKGDGARIKNFLKALRAGKSGTDVLDVLLDGRTFEDLEKEITLKFKKERLNITFSSK